MDLPRLSPALAPRFAAVRWLVTDVDGTMTGPAPAPGLPAGSSERLGARAYGALWALKEAGFGLIAATGRSAAWADMMLRQWPIDAVVAENGAVAYWLEGGRRHSLVHPRQRGGEGRGLLDAVWAEVARRFPGARQAADQPGRLFDLAIDYAEDEPRLDRTQSEAIVALCRDMGAIASASSVHVNVASAPYGKADLAGDLLSSVFGLPPIQFGCAVAAIGDGANDQSLFAAFPLGVGVANIGSSLQYMEYLPMCLTEGGHGLGFAEFAFFLIEARKAFQEKK